MLSDSDVFSHPRKLHSIPQSQFVSVQIRAHRVQQLFRFRSFVETRSQQSRIPHNRAQDASRTPNPRTIRRPNTSSSFINDQIWTLEYRQAGTDLLKPKPPSEEISVFLLFNHLFPSYAGRWRWLDQEAQVQRAYVILGPYFRRTRDPRRPLLESRCTCAAGLYETPF